MSNLKFNAIFESPDHSIAFIQLNGAIEETNTLFKRTFSLTSATKQPFYLWDLLKHGETNVAKQTIQIHLHKAENDGFSEFLLSYTDHIHVERTFKCTLRSYEDATGKKIGFVLKVADVTESIILNQKLEETKERYHLSLLGSGDGLWDWKVQEDQAFFSPRFRELMGYPAVEYIGGMQALMEVLHPDDIEATTLALQEHLLHKKPFYHEYRLKTVNDDYRWFLVQGQAVWNDEGIPVRMAGSLTDIHKQKELEVELKKTYRLQNKVMQVIPDVVLLLNTHWQIKKIFSSRGQLNSIGIDLVKGANLIDTLPKKYAETFHSAFQNLLEGNITQPFFIELKKGTIWFEFEVHLELLHETDLVCILRDITNARSFEREIMKNELKYMNLLDNMRIGLLEVDNKETIRYASTPFLELTGYALNDLLGKNAAEILSLTFNIHERNEIITRRKKGISDQYIAKIKTKKGDIKDLFISAAPLINPNGTVTGSVGLHIDVTEERKKSTMLEKVKEIGKIGTFEIDLLQNRIVWDTVVRSIFEVGDDFEPTITNGIPFYKQGESRNRIQAALQNAIENGSASDEVYEIITAKGNSKWIRVVAYIEKTGNRPTNIIGHTLDVTFEKLQTLHFEKLKNHYESIAIATNEIFFDWNFDTDLIDFNDSYYRITHQIRDQHNNTGASFISAVYTEDQLRFKASLKQSMEEKNLWETSFRLKTTAENPVHLQLRGRFRFNETGKPTGIIGIMSNISNIIELQSRLLEQEVSYQKKLGETALAAEQNERQFIGQELHDNVAQLLVVAQLHLNFYLNNPVKNESVLKEGVSILNSTIQEIRKLSHRLTGYSLKDEGIKQALVELVGSLNSLSKIKFNLSSDLSQLNQIDINKSLVLYRICQELLSNVVKYSSATECMITLNSVKDSSLRLCVKDNGKGFDFTKVQKGVGLNYTIDRVKVYGGNNYVNTAPGKGCEICLEMPV